MDIITSPDNSSSEHVEDLLPGKYNYDAAVDLLNALIKKSLRYKEISEKSKSDIKELYKKRLARNNAKIHDLVVLIEANQNIDDEIEAAQSSEEPPATQSDLD